MTKTKMDLDALRQHHIENMDVLGHGFPPSLIIVALSCCVSFNIEDVKTILSDRCDTAATGRVKTKISA